MTSSGVAWLGDLPEGRTDWDRLAGRCPQPLDALAGLLRSAWDQLEPVLFELVRLRVAATLGNQAELRSRSERATAAGLTEERRAALASWPTSALFDDHERSCLRFVEQFVIDANGVSDAEVAAIEDHFGPAGCHAFVQAVSVIEGFQRACLTLGIESVPDVDALVGGG